MKKFTKLDKNNIEAYTPKYAVEIVIPYLKKLQETKRGRLVIWCPFSKENHNFPILFKREGFNVIFTHFDPLKKEGQDFLTFKPTFDFDIIVDNPPFKNKTKFVKKVFEYNKPFALFLPFPAVMDNGIPNLFIENNSDIQLLIPKRRTEFHNQNQKGISFKTIYICKNILPKQIIFTKMNKVKLIRGDE